MTLFIRFISVFLLLSVVGLASAEPTTTFRQSYDNISMELLRSQAVKPRVWLLEDKDNSIDIQNAQLYFAEGRYQEAASNFNLGFSNSAYWVRFAIAISSGENKKRSALSRKDILLEFDYPHLDKIDIYRSKNGSPAQHFLSLGDGFKFSDRVIKDSVFVFPDSIDMDGVYQYWIKIDTTSSLMMVLSIWDKNHYIEEKNNKLLAYGIYYGILLVMMVYNAFIGFSTKDKSYAYYVGYIASFLLFQACLFGHAYQYFWPENPKLNEFALPSSIIIALIFTVEFSRSFLQTKRNSRFFNSLLLVMLVICIAIFVLSLFVGYRLSILMTIGIGIPIAITILAAALHSWMRGFREARIFFLAWIALLVGAVIIGFHGLGWVPTNLFTRHAAQFGSALEVILLSLALADRINSMKAERRLLEKRSKEELENKNDELKQALKLLTKNNNLKDEFLATISHELRTPMNGIEGSLQVIQEEVEDEKIRSHVDAATYSANYMTQLVESLLEYSELQSGNWKLHMQSFDLSEVVSKCSKMVESDCLRKGIVFSTKRHGDINHQVVGDYHRIQHMLFQLLDNALKFTHQGNIRLEVNAEEESDAYIVEFSVTDTGIGISDDKLKVIFESFRQMDGSFSRQYGGLGIGLSLCKAITDKMKGDISVKSVIGEGTTIDIRVRLEKGVVLVQKKLSGQSKRLEGNPVVLVVEDNPVNQMTLRAIIKKLGCQVETADNGEEAVCKAKTKRYDCILMDCQMPILDGFEATKIIRRSENPNTDTTIIAVTANAMSGDRDRCLNVGMDDYIRKPVKKDIIYERLNYWLSKNVAQL